MKEIRLGELLIQEDHLTSYQLDLALAEQKNTGFNIGKQLVELDFITKEECLQVVAEQLGMEAIHLPEVVIPSEIIDRLEYKTCDDYQVIPVREENGTLYIAMADPQNLTALDDISFVVGQPVSGLVSDHDDLGAALEKYYANQIGQIGDLLGGLDGEELELLEEASADVEDITKLADARPVVQLLNLILKNSIRDKAADIHFEPYEDSFRVRYRVDGVLYEMNSPPKSMATALVARIKIISKLNIAETRLPQDGRIALTLEGRSVDLRVSIVPTKYGESAVLRILDRSVVALDLHNLNMSDQEINTFQEIINKPDGIVLVTGPTGAGKTTTLYACLNEINKPEIKIITNEDPVEYNIDGLIQVPINPDVGLSYASSLRATLRQDPDVILVGEIRDHETATIAIESALTGHLVFSTLHTNDAPSSITRIIDLGIEPFLVTATVEAIVAQRLVRTICIHCKTDYIPTDESLAQLGIDPSEINSDIIFYRGTGCDNCRKTGYSGRVALYEILEMNSTIRDLILKEASSQEIAEVAIDHGMKTLREVGIQKIYAGLTTPDEVIRETIRME